MNVVNFLIHMGSHTSIISLLGKIGFITSHTWTYNWQCVQPMFSTTCGIHCLFNLYHFYQGMDAKTILKMYSINLSLNNTMAEEDLESHILEDIEIDVSAFIVNQICDALVAQNDMYQ